MDNQPLANMLKDKAYREARCGMVWHTQGSGKSQTMVFYTGKLVLTLDNPTIVVLIEHREFSAVLMALFIVSTVMRERFKFNEVV